jgi:hypothetical protein
MRLGCRWSLRWSYAVDGLAKSTVVAAATIESKAHQFRRVHGLKPFEVT